MLGGLFGKNTITIYNILSGTQISSHSVQKLVAKTIWTHGEYLQFAVVKSGTVTIWEVSFTSGNAPTQISSLSTPDNFSEKGLVFLPTLSWLAFICEERIVVWDAQHQRILLNSIDVEDPEHIAFSPGGHFFICETEDSDFHLWKETPNGYLPHQKFICEAKWAKPFVSPNGESIILSNSLILQLWHTTKFPTAGH